MGKAIKLLVVVKSGNTLDAESLISFLESQLEAYKIPKVIEQIQEIPKTFNGKIDRKKLIN